MASTLGGVDYSAIKHPEVARAAEWAQAVARNQVG